jgi:hypothetical protein
MDIWCCNCDIAIAGIHFIFLLQLCSEVTSLVLVELRRLNLLTLGISTCQYLVPVELASLFWDSTEWSSLNKWTPHQYF